MGRPKKGEEPKKETTAKKESKKATAKKEPKANVSKKRNTKSNKDTLGLLILWTTGSFSCYL